MKNLINEFTEYSRIFGDNVFWIQGPGGNTSIKMSDRRMIVKSSGSELSTVTTEVGYTYVDPVRVNDQLRELAHEDADHEFKYAELVETAGDPNYKRPSMELGFHTWLEHKYVFHFHSAAAALAGFVDDHSCPFEIFHLPVLLPGYSLSQAIMALPRTTVLKDSVIFLQNHGVILAINENANIAIEKYRKWESVFWSKLNPPISYDKISDRNELYTLAASIAVDKKPLFPDSVVLETRISNVVESAGHGLTLLNRKKAVGDRGAADLYSVQALTYLTAPNCPQLPEEMCEAIRSMPTELARKKIIAGHK